jgi:hypothetical protein
VTLVLPPEELGALLRRGRAALRERRGSYRMLDAADGRDRTRLEIDRPVAGRLAGDHRRDPTANGAAGIQCPVALPPAGDEADSPVQTDTNARATPRHIARVRTGFTNTRGIETRHKNGDAMDSHE